MATNWLEVAQRWAESARAGVASDRKRLQEILAAKERKETLAAIDEGVSDAKAGRVVSAEEVHQLLPQWIEDSRKPSQR